MKLSCYGASVPGTAHPFEDRILVDEKRMLFAVADGVTLSTRGSGGVAADMTLKLLEKEPVATLPAKVRRVNKKIVEMKRYDSTIGETTLVAASVNDNGRMQVAGLGDSLAYLFRGGRLELLVKLDEDTSGGLLHAVGYRSPVHVNTKRLTLKVGDVVILASDGVEHVLDIPAVLTLLSSDPKEIVESILKMSKEIPAPYDDDKSLIVFKVIR